MTTGTGSGEERSMCISVVMPTYNEEASIAKVIEDIRRSTRGYETEVIIVDSSVDNTPLLAARLGVKVITQPPQGHAAALKTALDAASGDYIVTADCDDTYPMEVIPLLISRMVQEGLDVISCNRMTPALGGAMTTRHALGNRAAALAVRVLYGIASHDVATGMFCIRKDAVNRLGLKPYPALPPEIIIRAGKEKLRYLEVDIPYRERKGESKLNFSYAAKEYMKVIFGFLFK